VRPVGVQDLDEIDVFKGLMVFDVEEVHVARLHMEVEEFLGSRDVAVGLRGGRAP
jgi:hypothetical protein